MRIEYTFSRDGERIHRTTEHLEVALTHLKADPTLSLHANGQHVKDVVRHAWKVYEHLTRAAWALAIDDYKHEADSKTAKAERVMTAARLYRLKLKDLGGAVDDGPAKADHEDMPTPGRKRFYKPRGRAKPTD